MTYTITCGICESQGTRGVYWEESHKTWWDRCLEHQEALEKWDPTYATVKHMINFHPGESHNFKFKVDRTWRTSLERQLMESLRIDNEHGTLMNRRTEYGANSIPRVTAQQPSDNDKKGA